MQLGIICTGGIIVGCGLGLIAGIGVRLLLFGAVGGFGGFIGLVFVIGFLSVGVGCCVIFIIWICGVRVIVSCVIVVCSCVTFTYTSSLILYVWPIIPYAWFLIPCADGRVADTDTP